MFDLLVRGGGVTPGGCELCDVGVVDGLIAATEPDLEGSARETIDAAGLHVVHVSTGRGVLLVEAARAAGVDVTCETCPHYLALDEDDAEQLGMVAKLGPPLRSRDDLDDESELTAEELLSRHRLNPLIGRQISGRVVRTIVRGSTVRLGGDMVASPGGRLVRQQPGRSTEARS
jgi:dihydroorotase-like cyclic amidohydrolase